MNLRNTIIAAALALIVAVLILRFVASVHVDRGCSGPRPCALPDGSTVDWVRTVPAANGRRAAQTRDGRGGSSFESDWEQPYSHDDSINALTLLEITDDLSFDDLVAELRRQSNPSGSEHRPLFETLVNDHPSSLDGFVTLNLIVCGAMLCVAELRSADAETLGRLIRDVTESETFAGRVIAELPGSRIYTQGVSRRLAFANDAVVVEAADPEERVSRDGEDGEN